MAEHPYTILVVDDLDPRAIRAVLEALGYHVLTASNGLAALDCLHSAHVDLMLVDVAMPGMDGYELLRRIRALPQDQQPAVLLASAQYIEPGDATLGFELGADDYLTKPFDQFDLKVRIEAKLRQRRLEKELRDARRAAEAQGLLLSRVLGIVQSAARSLDPETLAETLVRELNQQLEVDRAALWVGTPPALTPLPASAPPLPPNIWQAIRDGESPIQEGLRLIFPLRLADEVEGLFDLTLPELRLPGTLTVLQALADSISILLRNTRYVAQVQRENSLHELFHRLSTQNASLEAILAAIREFLHTHLLLVDSWFNVMVGDQLPYMVQEGRIRSAIVQRYQQERLTDVAARRRRSLVVESQEGIPFHRIYPLVLGGEVTAFLLAVPTEGTRRDELAADWELERIARFLAGVLQRERETALRERSLRTTFLTDLLFGRLVAELPRPTLFLRANALGLNLAHPALVAQVELPNFDQQVDWTHSDFDQRVEELLAPLLNDAQRARHGVGVDGVEVMINERVVVVLSLPPGSSAEQAKQLGTRWAERLQTLHKQRGGNGPQPATGLGRLAEEGTHLPRSADEAGRALRWALSSNQAAHAFYGDLGSERLLAAINDEGELRRFRDEQLAPVLDYDQARDGELIQTLERFFSTGGQMSRAAQLLAIHPNTLKYRLDQIAQLLDRDPRAPAVALDLQLALKIHRML